MCVDLVKVSSGWREKVVAVCGAGRDGVEVEERREEGVQGEEGESESAPDKNTASEVGRRIIIVVGKL